MANRINFSGAPAEGKRGRHGQKGYVAWRIEVLPETKQWFATRAADKGKTLKNLVNEALIDFIAKESPPLGE